MLLDLSSDMTCLKELFHMGARIYNLFGQQSEAIKLLKKWRRLDQNSEKDHFTCFAMGFLYVKNDDPKEGMKWLKKVFSGLSPSDKRLSENFRGLKVIYMSLYEIACIKFKQGEHILAERLLNEIRSTYMGNESMFEDFESRNERFWKFHVGTWKLRFQKISEMLEHINEVKENAKPNAKTPEDLAKVIKLLEDNRIQFQGGSKDLGVKERVLEYFKERQYENAIQTYQTFFEDMKVETNPTQTAIGFTIHEKLCAHVEIYYQCLFLYKMYEEALEFLHMALQKIKAITGPQYNCLYQLQYKILQYIARIYCLTGEYQKSGHTMIAHFKFRAGQEKNSGFLKEPSESAMQAIMLEEVSLINMNHILFDDLRVEAIFLKNKATNEDFERNIVNNVEQYLTILDTSEAENSESGRKFTQIHIALGMHLLNRMYKIHLIDSNKKDDYSEALSAALDLHMFLGSRVLGPEKDSQKKNGQI